MKMRSKGTSNGRFTFHRRNATAKPSPVQSPPPPAAKPLPVKSSPPPAVKPPTAPAVPSRRELEGVFRKFDSNGDGKISKSELSSVMGALGCSGAEEEIDRMMKEADTDKDGFISLEEFVDANTKNINANRVMRDLENAFKMYDLDNDGSISVEELYRVLKNLGEVSTFQECQQMIKSVDTSNRGSVSFEDFKTMMTVRHP